MSQSLNWDVTELQDSVGGNVIVLILWRFTWTKCSLKSVWDVCVELVLSKMYHHISGHSQWVKLCLRQSQQLWQWSAMGNGIKGLHFCFDLISLIFYGPPDRSVFSHAVVSSTVPHWWMQPWGAFTPHWGDPQCQQFLQPSWVLSTQVSLRCFQ